MGWAGTMATGTVGGATTMIVRTATRKMMRAKSGEPRLPRVARRRRGWGTMLAWAAAAGVLLALADLLLEQRSASTQPVEDPYGRPF